MRLWHYRLLPYLPDAQLKGQLRELVAIMHDWRDKGKPNHVLINRVILYSKSELYAYWKEYCSAYYDRFGRMPALRYINEFHEFQKDSDYDYDTPLYAHWHNNDYLRVCMANLFEKRIYGFGKSRISEEDWNRLKIGYKTITGKEYLI